MLMLLLCNVFTLSAAEELYAQHYNVTLSLRNATVKEAVDAVNGIMIVTADHGNADQMTETKKGKTSVRTAHSLNPVPFIIYDPDHTWVIKDGHYGLANVAPTIVKMMGLTAPDCWEDSMV